MDHRPHPSGSTTPISSAGRRVFSKALPPSARPLAKWFIRRKIAKSLWAQGMGRHRPQEIDALGVRDIEALSTLLGDKPYLFGDTPRGADATVFAFVARSRADGNSRQCATRRWPSPILSPIATA